jgi:hypothetical protein
MTRIAIAIAAALLFAAPTFAAERTGTHAEVHAAGQTAVAKPAKPKKEAKKRKPMDGETSDYLVVTLTDASVMQ